ncbi:MAG: UvrD-helicase domain-containing protein, partial [Chitinispirillaceae bacterium]|nr:UvrD-helicase domain-containing protein [Chitinispirillaceae bacterium]
MLRINLNKHGIIEAHAGTGKTWTIVNGIVLPAICGKDGERLHIRDFLLVTYTEKAAGELKERIRKEIEERLKKEKDPNLKSHLENCLNTFHEAYIGTIHSIC